MSDSQLPPDPATPPPGPPTDLPTAPTDQPDAGVVEAPAEPAPSGPNLRSWLVAGGVAAVLAVGAGFVLGGGGDDGGTTLDATDAAATDQVGAAPTGGGDQLTGGPGQGQFPGQGTSGTISAIDGDTLTVDGDDGSSTTVQTDDDTVVRETAEGSVDDLAEGDNVLVVGESDDDGNVTATNVIDNGDAELSITGGPGGPGGGGPPQIPEGQELPAPPDGQELPTPPEGGPDGGFEGGPGGLGRPNAGEITSIDGDTITIETADGESVTATLTDDTTVSVTQDLSVDDLEEGDTVRVMGETVDDVLTASTIQVGDAGFGGTFGGPPGAQPPGDVVTEGDTDAGDGL